MNHLFRVRDKMHLSFMQNRYFMLLLLYDFLLSMSDIIQKARREPEPRPEQVAGDLVNVRGVESACCCELNWLELIRRRAWTVYEVGNYIRCNGKIKTWKPLFFGLFFTVQISFVSSVGNDLKWIQEPFFIYSIVCWVFLGQKTLLPQEVMSFICAVGLD